MALLDYLKKIQSTAPTLNSLSLNKPQRSTSLPWGVGMSVAPQDPAQAPQPTVPQALTPQSPVAPPATPAIAQTTQAPVAQPDFATQLEKIKQDALNIQSQLGTAQTQPQVPTTPFKLEAPTTPSTEQLRGERITYSDIQSQLKGQTALQQQYLQALQPSAQEQQLVEQMNTLNQQARQEIERSENRLAPTFAITGEQAAIDRQASIQRQGLADNLNALIGQRQTQIDGLTAVMQFSKENLDTLFNLQKLTMPDVLTTQTDPQTGEIFVITRDPQTGEITQQTIGQLTPEASQLDFLQKGTYTNAQTGDITFWGLTQDGQIVNQIVGNQGVTPQETGAGGIYDILDYRSANAVLAESKKFEDSPTVKRFNAIQEFNSMVQNIDPTTQNPADHQVMIYSFAKALDPESVVREGEYATISKYAQSLLKRYEKEITNAINGTGFLSEKAIMDIQTTIAGLEQSRTPLYNNLRNESARQINNIAGKSVADLILPSAIVSDDDKKIISSNEIDQEIQGLEFESGKSWFSKLFGL